MSTATGIRLRAAIGAFAAVPPRDDLHDSGGTIYQIRHLFAAGGCAGNLRFADMPSSKPWFVLPSKAAGRRDTMAEEAPCWPDRPGARTVVEV